MAENRLLQNLAKTPGSHCCIYIDPESVNKWQIISAKLNKLPCFPLNTSDYATACMGGTTSKHTETVSWTLGSLPSCTVDLKFASDAIISKCWVWFWNRKGGYDSFPPPSNI